jgi:hypothetical protein
MMQIGVSTSESLVLGLLMAVDDDDELGLDGGGEGVAIGGWFSVRGFLAAEGMASSSSVAEDDADTAVPWCGGGASVVVDDNDGVGGGAGAAFRFSGEVGGIEVASAREAETEAAAA